jgi:pilus assembly protein CpaE
VSVVISRFDAKSEITNKDIEQAVGEPIRQTFPSDYRVALDALNKGRPLVLDNHSKLATTIGAFARELAKIEPQPAGEEVKPTSFLGRLTGGSSKR